MNLFSLLTKEDYLMIKWQIVLAVIGIILAVGIFMGVDYLSEESARELRIAQSDFDAARTRVDQIEEEEDTIIEYIGRYQTLDEAGTVKEEDRLQILEDVADIRADNNLWPVSTSFSVQQSMNLTYPPDIREPGKPIALRSSVISLELPLLHENDLVRLLDGILTSPGLFQTKDCNITLQNPETTNFIVLSQNFQAKCDIYWYTFDLDPPQPDPFGF